MKETFLISSNALLAAHNFGFWLFRCGFLFIIPCPEKSNGSSFFAVLSVEFSQLVVEIILLLTLGGANSDWKQHVSWANCQMMLSQTSCYSDLRSVMTDHMTNIISLSLFTLVNDGWLSQTRLVYWVEPQLLHRLSHNSAWLGMMSNFFSCWNITAGQKKWLR